MYPKLSIGCFFQISFAVIRLRRTRALILQNIITCLVFYRQRWLHSMPAKERPWFKLWPNNVPKHLRYPKISLSDLLSRSTKKHPESVAMSFFDREITYEEFDLLSNQFARGLSTFGVGKSDCVAILLPNIPQFLIAYYGVLKAGGVVTAVSPLHREREIQRQLADSEARAIVVSDSNFPIVEAVWQKTKLNQAIITGIDEFSGNPTSKPALSTREASSSGERLV